VPTSRVDHPTSRPALAHVGEHSVLHAASLQLSNAIADPDASSPPRHGNAISGTRYRLGFELIRRIRLSAKNAEAPTVRAGVADGFADFTTAQHPSHASTTFSVT
jgi:hypothetical protein